LSLDAEQGRERSLQALNELIHILSAHLIALSKGTPTYTPTSLFDAASERACKGDAVEALKQAMNFALSKHQPFV
jgi:hypothetical protein